MDSNISLDTLKGLSEAEYTEIISYTIKEYEIVNTQLHMLIEQHHKLHKIYTEQKEVTKSKELLESGSKRYLNSGTGAFEVVEEAVKELSRLDELNSINSAKKKEIKDTSVASDNRILKEQIAELKTCLIDVTNYMKRNESFSIPEDTIELCNQAKQFIVSNHAVNIADLESKHMLEVSRLKVEHNAKLEYLEMQHSYRLKDAVAKYDTLILEKEDEYLDQLRSMDEKVYSLESELTMLKGDISREETSPEKDVANDLKSPSSEFIVHVTKHASQFKDTNKLEDEFDIHEVLTTPKKGIPRRQGLKRAQSLKSESREPSKIPLRRGKSFSEGHNITNTLGVTGIRRPSKIQKSKSNTKISNKEDTKKPGCCEASVQTTGTALTDMVVQTSNTVSTVSVQTLVNVVHTDTQTGEETKEQKNAAKPKSKYKSQVDELDDLWNDLVPVDESYLVDCSIGNMDFAVTPDKDIPSHQTRAEKDNAELEIPQTTENLLTDNSILTDVDSQDDIQDNVPDQNRISHNPNQLMDSKDDVQDSQDLFGEKCGSKIVPFGSCSPENLTSRILELQKTNDTLREELDGCVPLSSVSEMQLILENKDNELDKVRVELENAIQENNRLHMLNNLHIENELAKDHHISGRADRDAQTDDQQEDREDQKDHKDEKCGVELKDVAVNTSYVVEDGVQNHPHKTNLTSLLSRLNLEDSKLGTVGDESLLNATTNVPELSFFDLTLTTGLADTSETNQTLLINHLCDIQSEAMKIHDRSEDLCRENEKLQNQVEGLRKELEIEKGKVKTKIKDLKEEREKCKKLDIQLQAKHEQYLKRAEELNKKDCEIKATKESHKNKLDEVVTCYKKEIENLTAQKLLTEEQAKGLAKIINNTNEPDKTFSSTDCQTSLVFSNFVLHMSTDPTTGCPAADNDIAALRQKLNQLHEEYTALKDHAVSMEETYSRQNEENNALIEITNNEKEVIEEELHVLQQQVKECGAMLAKLQPTDTWLYGGVSQCDTSAEKIHNLTDDTVNFTQLTHNSQHEPPDGAALSEATRHFVGLFKTCSEQVQELQQALENKSTSHQEIIRSNSNLQIELNKKEAQLKNLKLEMVQEEDSHAKLLEANKTIAKLKGEILKLSSEVQNGQMQNSNDNEDLVEELKTQNEKLEEIKVTLLSDVQLLREQLDEEQGVNQNNARALQEANCIIEDLRSEIGNLERERDEYKERNLSLGDKIKLLEEQLVELQQTIRKEKETTKLLLEKADDVTSLKHRKAMELNELRDDLDRYKSDMRKKNQELEELQDTNSALQRKLSKLQPSLDSYEEVNTLLKNKLKDTKELAAEFEHKHETTDKHLRKARDDLHDAKEELASAEERIDKLQGALEELQAQVHVRKKSAATQALVSNYDVGSNCTLLASAIDPELHKKYEELKQQTDQIASDLKNAKRQKGDVESQLQNILSQQSSKDNVLLQLQQDHTQANERLRDILTAEKEAALSALKRDLAEQKEAQKKAIEELKESQKLEINKHNKAHQQDLKDIKDKLAAQESLKIDRIVSDMEIKRQQDTAMIARKVGLDPETLSTLLPGSAHLTDRVEALHNQAVQIRDLALTFYEASHPPTRNVAVQAAVKVFKCASQTVDSKIHPNVAKTEHLADGASMQDFIKVFKEEHDKQTEVLLSQLRPTDKPATPADDMTLLKEELERLRLSIETYTTRCAMLEHNNRILKDRNTGLENDLMISASQQNSYNLPEGTFDDTFRPYDSHIQQQRPDTSQHLRKRLADCQREIGNLHNSISEYQDTVEQLELEIDELKRLKDAAEKRSRCAESELIEYKNDKILQDDDKDEVFNKELKQAKESGRLLERENKKLKEANGKLKNLNISLMQSNEKLKHTDAENFVMNISNKSNTLISEIDSIKAVEDLKFELTSKETELSRKKHRITLLDSEVETKTNMINAQRDELDSKEKVIQMIKSELSAQQLDIAEVKAMLDIERSKSEELERRCKTSSKLNEPNRNEVAELYSEIRKLRVDNSALMKDNGACESPSSKRVTRAYIKYLRAESSRKALVFQKQYLLSLLSKARAVESAALSILEIKKDASGVQKRTFKHAGVAVIAMIRMKNLVRKWNKIKQSLDEKQRSKMSTSRTSNVTEHREIISSKNTTSSNTHIPQPLKFNLSPRSDRDLSPIRSSGNSSHSGYPKWDSSRPLSPPSHPRDGLTSRVYGSPSPDASLSRLDQQLARLRQTINTRAVYSAGQTTRSRSPDLDNRFSDRVPQLRDNSVTSRGSRSRVLSDNAIPERDTTTTSAPVEDDGAGTLSDISNYISRLEAVQSRLTDLKLSSYKMYETNS